MDDSWVGFEADRPKIHSVRNRDRVWRHEEDYGLGDEAIVNLLLSAARRGQWCRSLVQELHSSGNNDGRLFMEPPSVV